MKRVAVTGLGIVAPTGVGIGAAWDAAIQARTGIAAISLFDASALPVRLAGEVKNFDPKTAMEPKEAQRATRFVQFAAVAAHEAMHDAGLGDPSGDRTRYGCIIGVGIGALDITEQTALILNQQGHRRVSPFYIPYAIPNMAAGVVSIAHHLQGPSLCPSTACASGTHAVGEAWRLVRDGTCDVVVAGGAEAAICPLGISAFHAMRALSTNNDDPARASRPFDINRDGFVMGEGAGILVLEEWEHARARGARIYAELAGYGSTSDAHHISAPSPDGEGAARCMAQALQTAGLNPTDVDHINAHGTSTKLNDMYESRAIMSVFGQHAPNIAIASTKGVTGHCLGAAGGIEAVYAVLAVHHQLTPPTAGWQDRDPECPLDYTPREARHRKVHAALSNSFGFGGHNAVVAFRRVTLALSLLLAGSVLTAPCANGASLSGVWKWASQFRVGVDESSSRDTMTVAYRTPVEGHTPSNRCSALSSSGGADTPRDMECTVDLVGGESKGYGIFFQRAFRRQGLFYWNFDMALGFRGLQGQLPNDQVEAGLPMKRLQFFLYGANMKPYIEFGITPAHIFPDLLFQFGPALQVLAGTVEINNDKKYVAMANGGLLGIMQAELILWRFGDGAFSAFASKEQAASEWDTDFFNRTVDGMSHFRARFARDMAGFRLLLPIP